MPNEVLFIGLGQIATSIAMNFANSQADILLVGHDPIREKAQRAKALGAVERLVSNPTKAIKSADIVILDVPPGAVHDHLEALGKNLKPGGIVIDTTPARSTAAHWADTLLPSDRHYLGVHPIVAASIFSAESAEAEQPRVDLFQDDWMAIVIPGSGSQEAISTAIDLVRLLGATPIFIDADEHDGIIATVEWLPILICAAISHSASKAGNWQDIQRMAGSTFAAIAALGSAHTPEDFCALNHEILRLKLRHFIEELHDLDRTLADDSGNSLSEYINAANSAQKQWLSARQHGIQIEKATDAKRIPKRPSLIAKWFGFHQPDD